MLGATICNALKQRNIPFTAPTRLELDLLDPFAVKKFIENEQPTCLLHLASLVYGIQGNLRNQLLSLSTNTLINNNVLSAIAGSSLTKVFFAGTVASYPFPYKNLPLNEDDFFNGLPHNGEYGYAASKIHAYNYLHVLNEFHGIKFIYGILTNLYGPNDRYDTENGHVIPSLICKAHASKLYSNQLNVWGSPHTTRDFLYIDDAADAILHLCEVGDGMYNIASGVETSMNSLVEAICKVAEIPDEINWNTDMPVGIPKRSIDITKLISTGFKLNWSIEDGVRSAYSWYDENINNARIK